MVKASEIHGPAGSDGSRGGSGRGSKRSPSKDVLDLRDSPPPAVVSRDSPGRKKKRFINGEPKDSSKENQQPTACTEPSDGFIITGENIRDEPCEILGSESKPAVDLLGSSPKGDVSVPGSRTGIMPPPSASKAAAAASKGGNDGATLTRTVSVVSTGNPLDNMMRNPRMKPKLDEFVAITKHRKVDPPELVMTNVNIPAQGSKQKPLEVNVSSPPPVQPAVAKTKSKPRPGPAVIAAETGSKIRSNSLEIVERVPSVQVMAGSSKPGQAQKGTSQKGQSAPGRPLPAEAFFGEDDDEPPWAKKKKKNNGGSCRGAPPAPAPTPAQDAPSSPLSPESLAQKQRAKVLEVAISLRVNINEISRDGQPLAWASQGHVAWATLRGSKVIAKTIPGPEAWFKKELHALAACVPCPHVVSLKGWSEDPSIHPPRRVLLMEPIVHRGFQRPMNLYERYTNNDFPFTAEKKMACLRDVCKALKFMHELRPCALFYRDLKSMNVCLREDDSACLVDLGLSMFEKTSAQYAQSHAVEQSVSRPATEGYICPTYKLTGVVESNTDIYALGVLALELIYEQYPVTSDGKGASNRPLQPLVDAFHSGTHENVVRGWVFTAAHQFKWTEKQANAIAHVVVQTTRLAHTTRPTAADVLKMLSSGMVNPFHPLMN